MGKRGSLEELAMESKIFLASSRFGVLKIGFGCGMGFGDFFFGEGNGLEGGEGG